MVGLRKKRSHTQKSHQKQWTPEIKLGAQKEKKKKKKNCAQVIFEAETQNRKAMGYFEVRDSGFSPSMFFIIFELPSARMVNPQVLEMRCTVLCRRRVCWSWRQSCSWCNRRGMCWPSKWTFSRCESLPLSPLPSPLPPPISSHPCLQVSSAVFVSLTV